MCYFSKDSLVKTSTDTKERNNLSLVNRRVRNQLPGFFNNPSWGLRFDAGDIVKLSYDRGPMTFSFEGLCLSVRNRGFGRKQTTLCLRNVIMGVGVEISIAYFLRRLYKLTFSDYKRKRFTYGKKRLYYLRQRLNRQSRVH